jgi:hypothetical protein
MREHSARITCPTCKKKGDWLAGNADRLKLLNMKNIQQPTSNIERPTVAARGFIGGWVLDVRCLVFPV